MNLAELQTRFARDLLERSAATAPQLAPARFPPERLIQVYRNNVFTNFTSALAAIYPVVKRLVGEDCFEQTAAVFIPRYPSRSANLHDYGSAFPEFLRGYPPTRGLEYLPDVARLEWAWHESFHAASAATVGQESLRDVPAEGLAALHFALHPTARLVTSPWPIAHIFEVNQPEFDGDQSVNLAEGEDRLLVSRPALEVQVRRLGAGTYALIEAMQSGDMLGTALERALAIEAGFDLGGFLKEHLAAGTFCAIEPTDNLEKQQ